MSVLTFFSVQDMLIKRKDHACAFVKIDEEKGVLVSGGVDAEDNLLDSVEFYSLESQQWTELSPLKRARTEHGMAMIGGLVTVIGGVSKTEFLSSIGKNCCGIINFSQKACHCQEILALIWNICHFASFIILL